MVQGREDCDAFKTWFGFASIISKERDEASAGLFRNEVKPKWFNKSRSDPHYAERKPKGHPLKHTTEKQGCFYRQHLQHCLNQHSINKRILKSLALELGLFKSQIRLSRKKRMVNLKTKTDISTTVIPYHARWHVDVSNFAKKKCPN